MNNEQKQALEFGVPLRETCEKLQWQEETFFFWVKDVTSTIEEIWDVCYFDVQSGSYKTANNNKSLLSTDDEEYKPEYVVPAPQTDKIAIDLPPKFHKEILGFGKECFDFFYKYSNNGDDLIHRIGYRAQFNYDIRIDIHNNHYAQAYAELWLKLKSENLL